MRTVSNGFEEMLLRASEFESSGYGPDTLYHQQINKEKLRST